MQLFAYSYVGTECCHPKTAAPLLAIAAKTEKASSLAFLFLLNLYFE